ncbi:WD40 repeat domain-containing protein [Peribacillus loiseleuriae]|uniref:Uncharacterized protein n=1 Tax=Peribacillus loiseleuriae TaxID=1679170 RepID=A0A0K9GSB0_9BACI|nr:WD40 repeat domain-containing protein [Peribacillus loiseleuriae]KMY49574.1 hypothetical protein AC625_08475 [Peribacillus loiseleuriae]
MDIELLHGFGGGGGLEINGVGEAYGTYIEALNRGDLVTTRRYFGFDTPVKMTDLTLPVNSGSSRGASFSPDDNYLAVGINVAPYLKLFKKSGDSYIPLPDPSVAPTTSVHNPEFSPDGQLLAVPQPGDGYIPIVYQRVGDVFIKLDTAAFNSISYYIRFASWSPDGVYLCFNTSAYQGSGVHMFKRNKADNTFVKLANLPTLPTSQYIYNHTWSPDGEHFVIGHQNSPNLTIYKNNRDDTFTKLANLPTLPGSSVYDASYSNDGTYLVVAHGATGSVSNRVYKRSGDSYTYLGILPLSPTGSSVGVDFSSDDVYLGLSSTQSPYIRLYKRDGDNFTKLATPTDIPTGAPISDGGGLRFANLNPYIAVPHTAAPFVTMYKADILGDFIHKYRSISELYYPNYINFGVALVTDIANAANKKIKTLPFKLI